MSNTNSRRVILLADDDLDDAEIFAHILEDIDPQIQFFHVKNGAELIPHLKNSENPRPDVIFLDLNMPQMNGWQSLTILKSDPTTRDIPVAIYTTSSQQRDRQQALSSGAAAFITKPSDYTALRQLLFRVCTALDRDVVTALQSL